MEGVPIWTAPHLVARSEKKKAKKGARNTPTGQHNWMQDEDGDKEEIQASTRNSVSCFIHGCRVFVSILFSIPSIAAVEVSRSVCKLT